MVHYGFAACLYMSDNAARAAPMARICRPHPEVQGKWPADYVTRGMVYQSTAEIDNNKKSPLNRGRAPVHATRPGMLRGRDPAVTLVSCAAPFARAPPPNARRSRPEMSARRTRSGDAQPRSARARNRGRKIKRKKHRHLSVQKSAPDFH